jgi:hypothetical protein
MSHASLNAQIAQALGWRIWEDMRPGCEGRWFMERDSQTEPGKTEVAYVPDYISILRDDVKMKAGSK